MSDIFDYVSPSGANPRSYNLLDQAAMAEVAYLQAIERHLIAYLAERYKNGGGPEIATLCDHTIDRSGRLLGRVRDVARGIKGWEPVDLVSGSGSRDNE